jgi:hypothetical protein
VQRQDRLMLQVGDIVGRTRGYLRPALDGSRGPGLVRRLVTDHTVLVRWDEDGWEELCGPRNLVRLHFPPNPHTDLCHHERPSPACRVLADWLREQGYPGCAVRVLSSPARRAPVLAAVARRGREGMLLAAACGYVAPQAVILGIDHGAPDGGCVAVFRLENGQIVMTGQVQRTRILGAERAEDGSGRPITLEFTYQDEPPDDRPRMEAARRVPPPGSLGAEIRQFAQTLVRQLEPEFGRVVERAREAAEALARIPADRVYPPIQFSEFISMRSSYAARITELRRPAPRPRQRPRMGPPPPREWWRRR